MADLPTSEIRFAVIGVGHIGLRHAKLITQNPDATLVALIDNRDGFVSEEEFARVPHFASIDAFILSGVQADVLCVCTPNYLHHPHTLAGLQHGLHIVCEKPMALEKAHCQEMIAAAQTANKHIFCVMQNRYSPPAVWLKEVVQSGVLGQIYHVQVNCFWNRDERYYTPGGWRGVAAKDGGTLFTQFSHFVDMLYWLFGDVQSINGQFKNFNHAALTQFEDSGYLQFAFERGGFGTFNYTTSVHSQNLESSITIIAENGSIKVGGQYMNSVEFCDIRNYTLPELQPCQPANNYGHYTGSAANHQFVFENVISTLRQQSNATTNAQEGLKIVEIIERMYQLKSAPEVVDGL
ncbi:putative dehydrogenase [Pontibacter aydingkolensis]|uniref:Gfo/Idh/MocA family oxidoreductase n=1 Tax=Pontibacter aydingkolensis TaxID=1911536 RepID=A0ABS7CVR6_9BACT|nr:Gfo/Idh/MocA family oxidoreductase [Pontibacter aydingkolensis]MBW7467880.1 Gfo/Idh/MocA family oxidoreductase [Pontibacter aydingkolensis]